MLWTNYDIGLLDIIGWNEKSQIEKSRYGLKSGGLSFTLQHSAASTSTLDQYDEITKIAHKRGIQVSAQKKRTHFQIECDKAVK